MSNITLPENLDLKDIKAFLKNALPTKGVLILKKEPQANHKKLGHVPCSLLPSPVPKICYQQALYLQQPFQQLILDISRDYSFLKESLQHVIKADEFTNSLWSIYDRLHREKLVNPLSLIMMRIDYMFHTQSSSSSSFSSSSSSSSSTSSFPLFSTPPPCQLKQIELNTIAASFAGLSQALSQCHKLVLRKFLEAPYMEKVPDNTCCDGLAEGLIAAWKAYGNPKAILVFLVGPDENNICDQSHLELAIRSKDHDVNVHRFTPQEVKVQGHLDPQRKLFIGKYEVAVVYLRIFYSPCSCEGMWQTRWMMESSKAIMVPNVGLQLAGTKKVQQVLTVEGVIERFINQDTVHKYACNRPVRGGGVEEVEELVREVKKVFMPQYALDLTEEGEAAMEQALKDPQKYVIKPQREGGGNNFYKQQIPPLLNSIRHSTERSAYILMHLINPWIIHNIPMRDADDGDNNLKFVAMVSELGVYGYLLSDGDETIKNAQCGNLLRTKKVGVNEGGVATGFSVLDSPFLLD